MNGMRIAFFGSSLVSSYWNGAATYYRGIVSALAARGHHITFFEPDAYDRQRHRDIADPAWAEVVVWQPTREAMERCLARAAAFDCVIKASGVGVFDAELEEAVPQLGGGGTSTVFWDVDAPATLDRVDADPRDPFRTAIPAYDLVLTYGGGEAVAAAYARLGARACHAIYNAVDPRSHHPVPSDEGYRADLTLLANRLPDREARIEAFFLAPAQRLPDRTFLLGGAGWEDKVLPGNVRRLGHVPTADHNRVNRSALAVLNVNRASMARYGHSPATRVFEAAGAGACLITDAFAGIECFLDPGCEVLVAEDGDAVVHHLSTLTRERAAAIGEAARSRVLAAHTYAHRAAEVERLLGAGSSIPREARA